MRYAPPVNPWDRFRLEAYEKLCREKDELAAENARLAVRVRLLEHQVEASARTSASLLDELKPGREPVEEYRPRFWPRMISRSTAEWQDARAWTWGRVLLAALLLALAGAIGAWLGM